MSSADVARRYFEALAARDVESAVALWAPGGDRARRRSARAHGPRRGPGLPERAVRRVSRSALGGPRRRPVKRPRRRRRQGRRPLARHRYVRRPRGLPGLRGQRRAPRDGGLRRPHRQRRGQLEHLDAYSTVPTSRASWACFRRPDHRPRPADQAGQRGHPGPVLGRRRRARAHRRRRVAGPGRHPQDDERLSDRGAGGVTVYDAGGPRCSRVVARAAARLGGVKRVVLGHADADHRGTAPGLGRPSTATRRARGGRVARALPGLLGPVEARRPRTACPLAR